MYEYSAKIISVHDGDTFTAEIDLGFNIKVKSVFRLFGVDTPELNKADQKAAGIISRDFVTEKLKSRDIIIQSIKAEGDKDKYGRYLAKVRFIDSDLQQKDLSELLIANNLAVAYFGGKKQ
ncbi:thermonuclease family protein [Flavobacterium sp.]|uniref:thermonuclease family protein n=1 Tax=Flavobacterium sp. TaxID=239 RepID=UPI0038FC7AAD